jgi:hypothetical protein
MFLTILVNAQAVAAGNRLIVDADESSDFKCVATLGKDVAKFVFHNEVILHEDGFVANDNPNSAIEYSWLVYFDEKYIGEKVVYQGFDIGVRYYTQDQAPRLSSLKEIINASDVHGFAYGNEYFIPIYFENDSLTVEVTNKDVVLLLRRSPSTSFFFDNPPKHANFWVIASKKNPRKCRTNVNHKD